jgi:hypothetical protein
MEDRQQTTDREIAVLTATSQSTQEVEGGLTLLAAIAAMGLAVFISRRFISRRFDIGLGPPPPPQGLSCSRRGTVLDLFLRAPEKRLEGSQDKPQDQNHERQPH